MFYFKKDGKRLPYTFENEEAAITGASFLGLSELYWSDDKGEHRRTIGDTKALSSQPIAATSCPPLESAAPRAETDIVEPVQLLRVKREKTRVLSKPDMNSRVVCIVSPGYEFAKGKKSGRYYYDAVNKGWINEKFVVEVTV